MAQKLATVTLTEAERRKWIETRSALLWKCPAFTHILFSMLNPSGGDMAAIFVGDEAGIPWAATDGTNLFINPKKFFALPLAERVFITAHEIMHCILNHCIMTMPMKRSKKIKFVDGTELPYDHSVANKAMDYVINDVLIEDKVGTFPSFGLHDKKIGTQLDSWVDVYKKIYEDEKGKGGNMDLVLDPGTGQGQDPGQAAQGRSEAEWKTAVAAAIASAKMQGKLPAGLERLLGEVVDPTVPWQDHVRATLNRKIGGGGFDWRKPDKALIQRDIYHPRRSGNGCGVVVVGVDTSGSIGQREIDTFLGEIRGILEDLQPTMIYLLWCDSKVHEVVEIDKNDELGGLKPKGGGGTDFRPVFKWVYDNDVSPEAVIYLTDGMGAFPDKAPSYPVIWGDIFDRRSQYPWGDVVDVKLA